MGLFVFEDVIDKDSLQNYFYVNAPAIIFPYVRSHISALTALSGMPSVNIPVMSLGHLFEDLKNNTSNLEKQ